jgi:hypothetical protein
MFLSQKPILVRREHWREHHAGRRPGGGAAKYKLMKLRAAECGSDGDLRQGGSRAGGDGRRGGGGVSGSYGLRESGLVRLIRKSYELLGLISFFTAGEDECRAWTIPRARRRRRARERSIPIWSSISFARRPSAGTRCWMRGRRRRRAARERCGSKARNTWCRMAT